MLLECIHAFYAFLHIGQRMSPFRYAFPDGTIAFMQKRTIHDILPALLKAKGLTPTEAARGAKVVQSTVQRIIAKKIASPKDDTVKPLADFLGVSADQLRGYAPIDESTLSEPPPGAEPAADTADIVREMLRKHGKGLSEEARQAITSAVTDRLEVREKQAEYITGVVKADLSLPSLVGDEIRIAHYDVEGAMGGGKVVHDYPEMLQDLRVSASHLRELGVTFEQPSHLKLMTGSGQSMEPTIRHLDPMIVNATVREFRGDAIYAFVWQSHFYVKRLAIADADHFTMISDNPAYPPVPIRMDETYIQAMVLIVWNARRV